MMPGCRTSVALLAVVAGSACAHPRLQPAAVASGPRPTTVPDGGAPSPMPAPAARVTGPAPAPVRPEPASSGPAPPRSPQRAPLPPSTSIFGRDTSQLGALRDPTGSGADADAVSSRQGSSLDKEIIRRIIRRHIEQVLACYEPERRKKADLSGRINVQFTIAASGDVTASRLVSSTMRNAVVEACTVAAVKGWEFPKPLG